MKSLFLRSGVVLACALTLASCGGKGGNLLLGGFVTGLTVDGLVLQNNGGDNLAVDKSLSTFHFPTLIGNDTNYNVTILTQPPNADCALSGNKGKSSNYDVTSIIVSCVTHSFDVGGTVSNLTTDGLVLNNGQDRQTISKGATSFTMTVATANKDANGNIIYSGKVPYGSPYGITVLTQPNGQTCTVRNPDGGPASGTMGAAAVTNIQVICN